MLTSGKIRLTLNSLAISEVSKMSLILVLLNLISLRLFPTLTEELERECVKFSNN